MFWYKSGWIDQNEGGCQAVWVSDEWVYHTWDVILNFLLLLIKTIQRLLIHN